MHSGEMEKLVSFFRGNSHERIGSTAVFAGGAKKAVAKQARKSNCGSPVRLA
jgi:hypothetical protein